MDRIIIAGSPDKIGTTKHASTEFILSLSTTLGTGLVEGLGMTNEVSP